MPIQSKPIALNTSILDSRSRAYMFGHQTMTKAELKQALEDAKADQELKGSLREFVIERYKLRISGKNF